MLKLVLSEYRRDFQEVWKREKPSWMHILAWVVYGFWWIGGMASAEMLNIGQMVWLGFFYGILFCTFYISNLYPNCLGKMFYLLPVSSKDRKQYLMTGYFLRVFFSTVLMGVLLALGIIFVGMTWFRAVFLAVVFFLMMCTYNIYGKGKETMGKSKRERRLNYIAFIVNVVGVLLLILVMYDWMKTQSGNRQNEAAWQLWRLRGRISIAVLFLVDLLTSIPLCIVYWHGRERIIAENSNQGADRKNDPLQDKE